jgi:uncharacterized protein YndB with AHSA1/START domain
MSETATDQRITFTRVFDAPRDLVWKAWTDPAQLAQWWGADGWTNPLDKIALDVRPGGAFSVTSVSDEDGTEMTVSGVYLEVVEPERVVMEEPAEGSWGHEGVTEVMTLADLGDGRTEMTVVTTIRTTPDLSQMAEAGMATSFQRLANHLAAAGR